MNLALFPLDTQTCHLTIASYGWAASDLVYLWKVSKFRDGNLNWMLDFYLFIYKYCHGFPDTSKD